MAVISTHNIIASDAQLAPRYLATQEKEISHFEDTLRFLANKSSKHAKGDGEPYHIA